MPEPAKPKARPPAKGAKPARTSPAPAGKRQASPPRPAPAQPLASAPAGQEPAAEAGWQGPPQAGPGGYPPYAYPPSPYAPNPYPPGPYPGQYPASPYPNPPGAWPAAQWPAPRKHPAGRWWIPVAGGVGLLLFLPFIFVGVAAGWKGPQYLVPAIPLSLLLVGLGIAGSWSRRGQASEPGIPAPFGESPYGLPAPETGSGYPARLRRAPPGRQRLHRAILWSPLVSVAVAALLVLPAILFGPEGVRGAAAGLGLLVAPLFLLAAYALAAYRALVPTAIALGLWGLLIEVQAVGDAWGVSQAWDSSALLLLVAVMPVQALSAEAAFRARPRAFWAAWTGVGTLLAVAYPVWLFFGQPGSGDLPLAMTLASLVWGVAANFAFAPVPVALRWAGVGIFALWAGTLLYGYTLQGETGDRLKAAGLVAAAAVVAIAFVAHFVLKATKAEPAPPA